MGKRIISLVGMMAVALVALLQPTATSTARAADTAQRRQFVQRIGSKLWLDRKEFRFAGTNNYYLMYSSPAMVDDVLTPAAANRFAVVRTWAWLDIGNQDGSNSIAGKANGVYFQYWNGSQPAFNDGADGLQRLDYVVAQAGRLGLKLVLPLTNNWSDFGGMDQYVRWRNGQYHDQFYTDPLIRGWYKAWIAHLLNRTNIYTGLQYKNDPTIMTWELGNEPRCGGSGVYPASSSCTTQTLISWADEMSRFIKSIDSKHLVSVGDEGFYCTDPASSDWTENCGVGVDTIAFTQLPAIDVMSFHLYPEGWGKDATWGTQWIIRHIRDARKLNKPVMLGEFGLKDKRIRNPVYKQWTEAVFYAGGNGALYWLLAGRQDDGTLYPDYDGFTVYATDPVFITLGNFAQMMEANRASAFPPVADDDAAVTPFETATTLTPAANDVAYNGAVADPRTIDLDLATAGRQITKSVGGGTFQVEPGGTVVFTPAAGFAGKAQISYTIKDNRGRISNPATLTVTVNPNPTGTLTLYSFETGTEGWAPGNWQSNAGTVAQSADFRTDGSYSLQVNAADGGWFGVEIPTAIDLTGKTRFKYDLKTTNAGTSAMAALKLGDSWTWCQANGNYVGAGTTTTVDLDLLTLGCSSPDLSKLHGIYIWISGGGTFYIDNVRAE